MYSPQEEESYLPMRSPWNSNNDHRQRRHPPAHEPHQQYHDERQQHMYKRRRVRQLLLFASLAFVVLLVIDGIAQFSDLPGVNDVQTVYQKQYEQQLQLVQQNNGDGGFVRKLVGAFLGEEELAINNKHRPHITAADGNNNQADTAIILNTRGDDNNSVRQPEKQRTLLHTVPLLPKHVLQHRQRRELINSAKPFPRHLQEGHEDEMFHAPPHQRRRIYPMMMKDNMKVVDRRNRHLADGVEEGNGGTIYETGAIYQGYGKYHTYWESST